MNQIRQIARQNTPDIASINAKQTEKNVKV